MSWFEKRSGLDGTVAVVTGGAGGLGAAIASDLAANDVRLAVIDKDATAAAALRESLDADGRDAVVHTGDVRDAAALEALFTAADEHWGRVDTLVNVAGGTFRAPFLDTTPKGWNALWRMNVEHVLHACSLAAPRMRAGGRGGSIISVTTIEAHRAAPGFAVYAAAKAAVEQFGRTLAVELAPDGIRVNNIAPDYVPTPNLATIGTAGRGPGSDGNGNDSGADTGLSTQAGLRTAIPMGRAGLVTDVSGCAVFLASDLSRFVTGSTLHPDGGTFASSGWFNWPGTGWANHVPGHLLDG
jgi:NAD(P)-dependent dehydrogenase (short-subunit alcohol dehydrogenase family)